MNTRIAAIGGVMQLAYVPRDIDAAVRFWTQTMGVGPFFRMPHIRYKAARYMGQPSNIDFSVLIAQWGEVQVELIEQHCDSPSIYRSWLDAGHEGVQHVCIVTDSIARARATCEAAGAVIAQEILLDGAEAFYADTGGGPGTMVEVIEPSPAILGSFAFIRRAAEGWDGSDPVRSF